MSNVLHYVLVDYENVPVKSLALLQGEQFRICVFLGKNNTRLDTELVMAMQKFGDRAQYVRLTTTGPNALDFHIAFYLGKLVSKDPLGQYHVISKDKGFDSLIERLQGQQVKAFRVDSIENMPCFPQAVAPLAAIAPPKVVPPKVAPPAPSPKPKPKAAAAKNVQTELDERVKLVVTDLQARKTGRPATQKTLVNTIHNRIGKTHSVAAAQAVFEVLVKKKHVIVNGLKVSYNFPKAK